MDRMSKKTCFTIVPVTMLHVEKVINFFNRSFYRDEPVNAAMKLFNEPNATCEKLEEHSVSCISEGLSIMAISSNGDVLAVCLNGSLTRNHNEDNISKSIKNSVNSIDLNSHSLPTTAGKRADVFAHFPEIERILDIKIVSVDAIYRGQGICKALLDKTVQIAREQAFPLIKVDCTSHFSAKAVFSLGFQCIFVMKYDDYVNEAKKILNVKFPHTCFKTFVMPLTVCASSKPSVIN